MDNVTKQPIKDSPNHRAVNFIIFVLVFSFFVGTMTHLIDISQLGFLGYLQLKGVNPFQNIFWISLVFIDPLVISLSSQ